MGKGKEKTDLAQIIFCLLVFAIGGGILCGLVIPTYSLIVRSQMLHLPYGYCNLEYGVTHQDYSSISYNTFCLDNVTAYLEENSMKTSKLSVCYPPPGVLTSSEQECKSFQESLPTKQTAQQVIRCYMDVNSNVAYINPIQKGWRIAVLCICIILAFLFVCVICFLCK